MTELDTGGLVSLAVSVFGLFVGIIFGRMVETILHREVCPCNRCVRWRKKRDADREFEEG